MKKLVIPMIFVLLLALVGGYRYYHSLTAFEKMVLCKSVNADGSSGEIFQSTIFSDGYKIYYISPKDTTVYISVKVKNVFIKKAMVRWYKGNPSRASRIKSEENIPVSKSRYVTAKFTIPEGFSDGSVLLYKADGREISEDVLKFSVKR